MLPNPNKKSNIIMIQSMYFHTCAQRYTRSGLNNANSIIEAEEQRVFLFTAQAQQ